MDRAEAGSSSLGVALDGKWHTRRVPTTRPRHVITETDRVSEMLRDAALKWPADSAAPTRLLLHLVDEGYRALQDQREHKVAARRAAVEETSGALSGIYGPNYLSELREDWPE